MNQARGGSDICEHEISGSKNGNPNPTCEQFIKATSGRNGHRAALGNAFQMNIKSNSSCDMVSFKELNEPLIENVTKINVD